MPWIFLIALLDNPVSCVPAPAEQFVGRWERIDPPDTYIEIVRTGKKIVINEEVKGSDVTKIEAVPTVDGRLVAIVNESFATLLCINASHNALQGGGHVYKKVK